MGSVGRKEARGWRGVCSERSRGGECVGRVGRGCWSTRRVESNAREGRARVWCCARGEDVMPCCCACPAGGMVGRVGMWGCGDVKMCVRVCEEDGSEGRGAAEQRQQRRHQEYGEGLCAEARGQKRETQSRAECTKQRGAWGRRGGSNQVCCHRAVRTSVAIGKG